VALKNNWANGDVFTPAAANDMANAVNAATQTTVLTVAASNTSNDRGSNYRCTGTNDQNTINAAIAALPTAGGRIKLLAGQYNLSGSVVIDRSHVDLEGESHMMWGGYLTSYGQNGAGGTGAEGFGGAKLKATTANVDLIRLANVNVPDNGENRHRGIRIAFLYLFGSNYTGKGVVYESNHDIVHISNLTCHKLEYGIYATGDASFIHHNNVQDCTNGIYYINGNGQVTNNIIWDCSGTGLVVGAAVQAPIIAADNNIGNCVLDGIEVLGPVVVSGNEVVHCKRNQIWLRRLGGATVSGNVIRTNSDTPSATGIRIDSQGNAVSGNTITALATTTGKAINIALSAPQNTVGVNVIKGTWGSPPVTLGVGNVIESNVGFKTAASGSNSVADGGTIAHGLPYTPTTATVSGTVAGEIVTVTSIGSTNITVAIKTGAGAAGTTQTVHWASKIDGPAYIVGPADQGSGALLGWFKADSLSLADNASVSTWPDSSALGSTLTPLTTAPIFKTAIINSLPVVRFDGSSSAMVSTLFPAIPQPLTIFVVAKQITTGTQTLVSDRDGGATPFSAYITSGGQPRGYDGGFTPPGPTVTTTNPHVYEWVFNGGSSRTGADGVVATTPQSGGQTGLGGGITIGANGAVSPGEYFNGDIAEVLVYSGELSTADCSLVRAALGTKYGITVTL
jgi:hypothetical protein